MFIMLKCRRLKTCLPYNHLTFIVIVKVLHRFHARVTKLLMGRKMQLKAQINCNINIYGNLRSLKCVPFISTTLLMYLNDCISTWTLFKLYKPQIYISISLLTRKIDLFLSLAFKDQNQGTFFRTLINVVDENYKKATSFVKSQIH